MFTIPQGIDARWVIWAEVIGSAVAYVVVVAVGVALWRGRNRKP